MAIRSDTHSGLGALSDPPAPAVIERTALERGEIRHKKTQAEIMNAKPRKLKVKAKGGHHSKSKHRKR
jgi:hypothetical protein